MSNVIHSAEGVRDMVDGDQFCFFGEKLVENLKVEGAVIEDWDDFQSYSQSFTKHLPWHGIRMVF